MYAVSIVVLGWCVGRNFFCFPLCYPTKTWYTGLDPNHMARVGPRGSDGQEIPVSLVYDQVNIAAKFSQQDYKLDIMLDGIEEEAFESK